MLNALNPGLGGLGSSAGQGHGVVFLGKTCYCHGELLGKPERMPRGT